MYIHKPNSFISTIKSAASKINSLTNKHSDSNIIFLGTD
jgi:hypothetical protein